uniref:Protein FAM136A n=1 Tax=Anthurium amnicola TaxID=1678845 RepID=A0A1D1Z860_9ARAE
MPSPPSFPSRIFSRDGKTLKTLKESPLQQRRSGGRRPRPRHRGRWREGRSEMEHDESERVVSDRLRKRVEEVRAVTQEHLNPIKDHVNFTLQQAYFKCAYECFDRRRRQEDINNCVEHCSVPVLNANNLVEAEMETFLERLQRAVTVCQDKFEAAKLQKIKTSAVSDLESCVDQAIEANVQVIPHAVDRLKASLSIS